MKMNKVYYVRNDLWHMYHIYLVHIDIDQYGILKNETQPKAIMKTQVRTLNMGTIRVPIIEIVAPLPTVVYCAIEEFQTLRKTAATFMTQLQRARAGIYTSIALFAVSIIALHVLVIFENLFENESTRHKLIHETITDTCITTFLIGLGLFAITWMLYPRIMLCNARLWKNWLALWRFIKNTDSHWLSTYENQTASTHVSTEQMPQGPSSTAPKTLTQILNLNPRCEKISVKIRELRNEAIEDLQAKRKKMKEECLQMSQEDLDLLEWNIHLLSLRVTQLASVIREFSL